jgi:DNA-binding protein H-NS
MVTLDAVNLKIAKLQKQAAAIVEKQSSIGLEKIRDLMHKHGLSLADIEGFVGKRRGRKPSKAAANGAAKSARTKAQPVAAKYVDPKSGATWSGRGRAPAWIKDVKDRSRFLIDGGSTEKVASKKTAPAKKSAGKRAAAKATDSKPAVKKGAAASRRASPVRKAATAPAKQTNPRAKAAAKKSAAVAPVETSPQAAAE